MKQGYDNLHTVCVCVLYICMYNNALEHLCLHAYYTCARPPYYFEYSKAKQNLMPSITQRESRQVTEADSKAKRSSGDPELAVKI